MNEWSYQGINGHIIGILMKELARRIIDEARRLRFRFETFAKVSHTGKPDCATTADTVGQEIAVKMLTQCTPDFGIVAEEADFRRSCKIPGRELLWVVDSVDGTRAYVRRQSHGVGTMVALADDRVLVAALVGDVNTNEFYYYRPGSLKTHRLSDLNMPEDLVIDTARPLSDQYLLLRDRESAHSSVAQKLFAKPECGGRFKNYEVTGGSIGISMARLWKREVGGCLLLPCREHPWDYWPIYGISQHLGFRWLQIQDGRFQPFEMPVMDCSWDRAFEVLVIHESRIPELWGE